MIHTTISQDEIDNLKYLLETCATVPVYRSACERGLQTVQKLQDQLTAVEEFNRQAAEANAAYDAQYEENDLPW